MDQGAAAELGTLGQADESQAGCRAELAAKPSGLRMSTSIPRCGEPLSAMVTRAPGACLVALVMPSWMIR